MNNKIKLKEAFEVTSKHGPIYTGGNVEWKSKVLFCQNISTVSLFHIEKGVVVAKIGDEDSEETDAIQTFGLGENNVATAHNSGLIKLWTLDGQLQKMWKCFHNGPIARLALNGDKLASGGSDGCVRIWDLPHQTCVFSLKGPPGIVNLVEFHPYTNTLLAAGNNGIIHMWSLENGRLIKTFDRHISSVTSLSFCSDEKMFISSGRDKLIILWRTDESTPISTIPLYESIETVICLPNEFKVPGSDPLNDSAILVATAGENGLVRIWNVTQLKEVYTQTNSLISKSKSDNGLAIKKLLYDDEVKAFAIVSAEQNIFLHDSKTFECVKQFVGFIDEILDLAFMGLNDSHLAVATNSADIKLYENSTMNCELLKGHTDLVLALSVSPANSKLLLSSSKDNTIRLWLLKDEGVTALGVGTRHMGSVNSISLSNLTTSFAVSVSQDTSIKFWEISKQLSLDCTNTVVAHEKDINCVVVSPNDKLIVTASSDKTAKLWSESLQMLGVFKGHKRGIWCVRFSPVDQIVATSSTDSTIKLWSIIDFTCLKTIEGHDASVHKIEFISNGLQILSASGDGLIKLFDVKSSECVTSLGEHEQRVWALSVNSDESGFVTGGADSLLIKWKDVTLEKRLKETEENENLVLQEQQLSNYVKSNRLLKALKLALHLDRPLQVLRIVQTIIKRGEGGLADTVNKLENDQKESLLKCATDWNTNSRYCQPAQLILSILIEQIQSGSFRPVELNSTIESVLPYTERHFKRVSQLLQDLNVIEYTINCIKPQ